MATVTLCGSSVCDGDLLNVLLHGLCSTEGWTDDGGEGGEAGQWKPRRSHRRGCTRVKEEKMSDNND